MNNIVQMNMKLSKTIEKIPPITQKINIKYIHSASSFVIIWLPLLINSIYSHGKMTFLFVAILVNDLSSTIDPIVFLLLNTDLRTSMQRWCCGNRDIRSNLLLMDSIADSTYDRSSVNDCNTTSTCNV